MKGDKLKTFLIHIGLVFAFMLSCFLAWYGARWIAARKLPYDLLLVPAECIVAIGLPSMLIIGLMIGVAFAGWLTDKK